MLRALIYPILLCSAALTVTMGFYLWPNFSLLNIAFLVFTIAYLAVMEKLAPYDRTWHPTAQEWRRDLIYLFITMVGGGLAIPVVYYLASLVRTGAYGLYLPVEIALGLLLSSFGSYAFHRLSHIQPWLWRLHGIHHVEEKVNVGNNGVNHLLDVFARRVCAQLPLIILGLSEPSLFVISIFNTMQGYFVHANIDVRLGVLNYVVVSPEQHRLHHSRDLNEAGHYSVDIVLWDLIFRSFTFKYGLKPLEVGVVEPKKFPHPDDIMRCLTSPFIPRRKISRTPKKKPLRLAGLHKDPHDSC